MVESAGDYQQLQSSGPLVGGGLVHHSAIFMVARMLPGLFGLATTAIITRLLSPEEYGRYGLMLAGMMIGSAIFFDWLGVSFLRFCQARRGDVKLIATFLGLFLGLIVISACVFLAACGFGIVRRDVIGIYAISVLMVWAVSWFELLARLPVSEFQPSRYLRMHVTRSIAVLVGTAAGAVLTKDAAWTAIGAAAGMFASSFSVRSPLMWPRRSNFDRELARDVIVFGFPLAASMAIASIIDGGSRLLLAFLDSAQALASYTAASILVQTAIGFIGMAVYTAGYSRVVIAVERDEHDAARQQLLANGALLLAVLAPASLGLALVGESLATIFVGPQLVPGVVAVIPWMAASTFLGAIRAYHLDQAFQLGKRPQLQVWMQLLGGATSVALCFYLIPTRGAVGAAMAVAGAILVSSVYAAIMGRFAYRVPLPLAAGARIAVCCAILAAVVLALPGTGWPGLALRTGLGALSYGLAAFALNLSNVRSQALIFLRKV